MFTGIPRPFFGAGGVGKVTILLAALSDAGRLDAPHALLEFSVIVPLINPLNHVV
jgi:hypothetical protein